MTNICGVCGGKIKTVESLGHAAWVHIDRDYDPFARPHVAVPANLSDDPRHQ